MRVSPINGPYWTSNINCVGTEDNLSQCDMLELGSVTSCENHHYAGVLCYDNEGMLTGYGHTLWRKVGTYRLQH